MESETSRFESGAIDEQLARLRSDREAVAARLVRARWFAPGMGAVAAVFVASPAIPDGVGRNSVFVTCLAASIALLSVYHARTGVKLSRVGARAALIYAGALAAELVLLSVSYGLAGGGLVWWIAASAGAAFLLITWLVAMFIAAVGEHVSHGV